MEISKANHRMEILKEKLTNVKEKLRKIENVDNHLYYKREPFKRIKSIYFKEQGKRCGRVKNQFKLQ